MSHCAPPDINDILGPFVVGYQFNWALYGVLVTQAYRYYLSDYADGWKIKAIVYGTLVIETIQIAFATHDSALQFAITWGQSSRLDDLDFIWITMPVTIALVSMVTQLFYAWRIQFLGVRRVVLVVIAVLSIFQGIAALYTAIRSAIIDSHSRSSLASNLLVSDVLWLSSTALCDILIFTFMSYHLSQMRTKTSNNKTDKIINDIIRLVVETGMVTAAAAIVDLVLFVTNNPWFAVLSLVLSKLYSNSLLVVLNSRQLSQCSQRHDYARTHTTPSIDHPDPQHDQRRK